MPAPIFASDPRERDIARDLHAVVQDLPLICPHGHVDPAILAEDLAYGDPARLLVVPDHYLTRMLLSQSIPPGRLGVGDPEAGGREIWRLFAENWYLFRGTPSRLWFERTLSTVFGVGTPLSPQTADEIYDTVAERLAGPAFRPRALFERFGIEVLATTESPTGDLAAHATLAADGWGARAAG